MAKQNKMSIWAVIILIATIISLVLLVTTITVTALALPEAMETAKQAAIDGGATEEEALIAVGIAIGAVVVALVLGSVFDVLKIIGGFMFSLKGRWGIFCIIVSIISVVFGVWGVIGDISNNVGVASIVTGSIGLAVSVLLLIACFKHKAELQ